MNGAAGIQPRPLEINLLQVTMRKAAEAPPSNRIWILMLLIAVLGLGALGWFGYDARSEAAKKEQEIQKVAAQIDQAKAQLAGASSSGELADFLIMPNTIKGSRPEITSVLDKLNKLLPVNANLSSLSFEDRKTANETPIKISALFATTEDIVSFTQSLKATKDFRFVNMGGLTKMAADPNSKQQDDAPLPLIQVTFDITYVQENGNKGGSAS